MWGETPLRRSTCPKSQNVSKFVGDQNPRDPLCLPVTHRLPLRSETACLSCDRVPVQWFRHGARALNLEACPELRMDAIGAIEDDAAIAATRPTSKLGGCAGSVSSLVTAQWCWWPLARPFWVGCHLASHRPCHADSQHGCCERAQTPGSVSGGVPGRGLDPSGRAAHASALLRSESLRPCISGPHRPS